MSGPLYLCRLVVYRLNCTKLRRLPAHCGLASQSGRCLPGDSAGLVSHGRDQHYHEFCRGRGADSSDLGSAATEKDKNYTDNSIWAWILVSDNTPWPHAGLLEHATDTQLIKARDPFYSTGAVAIARILTAKRSALSLDVTWDSVPVTYYSVIEVNVGIICACVITLRPLLTDIFPSLIKSSYGGHGDAAYYARERNNGTIHKTKKSSRETMTHADHGIYGLADLEVNRVLNGSQEGLTSAAPFEPAHFNTHRDNMPVGCPRMLTSITSGGKMPSRKLGEPLLPVHRIRTRSGDIMITRETTIREETVDPSTLGPMSPAEKDDQSWFTESSTRETQHPDSSSS